MDVRRVLAAGAACVAAVVVPGCGGDDGAVLDVFAAASLTDAFADVAAAFERDRPGTEVALHVAGSSALREQILAGAPGDVVASADTAVMDDLVAAGAAEEPVVFARNRLRLVVPAGNPAGVRGLDDLGRDDLLVGLCAPQVPCGRLGRAALRSAGVAAAVDTEEPDVRSLLTKVEAGELDVGLVYVTDVLAAGDAVEGIDVPAEHDPGADYPVAVLRAADDAALARAFVELVLGDDGRAILAAHGFDAP